MTEVPRVAILHSVGEGAGEQLATTIQDRLGNIELQIAETPPESREVIADATAILTLRLSAELLDETDHLEWVQAGSAGVDHYDLERLRQKDVVLTNASGVHAEPIAEQVLGYLLMFERKLLQGVHQQHRGVWERYSGGELRGKTLGIVGLGAIGTRVAELGSALGMTTIGTKRDPTTAPDVVDETFDPNGLHEVLARADYLILACPLTDETRGLIGKHELSAMGSDTVLVNIARGAVVEQAALTRALQQRWIGGAALDVFDEEPLPSDSPLWDLSNVIITPHMAGSTPYYWERLGDLFVDNYRRFTEGDVDGMVNRVV